MVARVAHWRLLNRNLSRNATTDGPCVVRIPNANIYRFGDPNGARPVLRAVDWTVQDGESWAVVGSGAGEKTALLEVSHGELAFTRAQLHYPSSLAFILFILLPL
jgi:ABC-type molybdenum transport system ATPase subunit/photorepair protein PhrA